MTGQAWKKLAIAAALTATVALFFLFDLHHALTLATLKSSQKSLQETYAQHPFAALAAYFVLYVLVVAANLPGAVIMSLAGAAIFGFWTALLVVSFASSLGATLACGLARTLFRDLVLRRFAASIEKIDAGIQREGAFYLFTLRLIPVVPFFAINLAMGLTAMPLRTFYWVSQLGMLPGTAVFVNAGKELGQLESLAGVLSPGLIISFALLGIFPLAAKKVLERYRRRRKEPCL